MTEARIDSASVRSAAVYIKESVPCMAGRRSMDGSMEVLNQHQIVDLLIQAGVKQQTAIA